MNAENGQRRAVDESEVAHHEVAFGTLRAHGANDAARETNHQHALTKHLSDSVALDLKDAHRSTSMRAIRPPMSAMRTRAPSRSPPLPGADRRYPTASGDRS